MKFESFKSFNEMDQKAKNQVSQVLAKHFAKQTLQFIRSNKNYIKKHLSGNNATIFEREVLKNDELKTPFLSLILASLDQELEQRLLSKVIKTLFKSDKTLADQIIAGKEIEEVRLAKYLSVFPDLELELIKIFFLALGTDLSAIDNRLKEQKRLSNIEKLQKESSEKDAIIEKMKDKASSEKKKAEESSRKLKEDFEARIKGKEEEIETLRDEINKLEQQLEKQKSVSGKIERKDAKDQYPLEKETPPKSEDTQKVEVPLNLLLDDLELRTFLGTVKMQDIRLDKLWIIVNPIVPILDDKANIEKEEFLRQVDYRGDYSTFILFIDDNLLRAIFDKEEAYNFYYYSDDEKLNSLYKALCGKILFFAPRFYLDEKDNKYKLNAHLVAKPIDYLDFANSTFVPSFPGSKKAFEAKVAAHENLILPNYPYSLSSVLRYVFVQDTLYRVNYLPCPQRDIRNDITWKFNGQEGKEPFQKLNLQIKNGVSDDCLLVPSQVNEEADFYVKNVSFLKASLKNNSIFDEEEFLRTVANNAKSRNLYYTEKDLKEFHVAIKSSNLVILAGPSGIGKTRLPMIYANSLGLDTAKNSVLFVPISPSYLEPEDVLGYAKPLSEKDSSFNAEYMESQTGLVSFLIDASEHKDKIHLVVFDEMNLSQIEFWFAPFISLLEQDPDSRELKLYAKNLHLKNGDIYPSSISIGSNVFFVGTVNTDETTKRISDRLLDRAVTINLSAPSFRNLKSMGSAEVEIYPEISFSRFATAIKSVKNPTEDFTERELSFFDDLNSLLTNSVYGQSVSFRSLKKMALYLKNASNILPRNEALDFVVSQMIVKKLRGSFEDFSGILSEDDTTGMLGLLAAYGDLSEFASATKELKRKASEIKNNGFTK